VKRRNGHAGGNGNGTQAAERSVLIAVQPESFVRLIEHVLGEEPGLRVVGRLSKGDSIARSVGRLAPDVIITNTRLFGREHGQVLAGLKRSSPGSTLILLTQAFGGPFPAPSGADGWLSEEAVVEQLVPMVQKLAPSGQERVLPCRN